MKKLCAILLTILIIALLVSCTNSINLDTDSESTSEDQTTIESTASSDTQDSTETQKIPDTTKAESETSSDTELESTEETTTEGALDGGEIFENDNEATYNDAWDL